MSEKEKMNIQWYPGHMTKTRRQIEADLKQVDAVCEIVDARIPMSSRNPDIDAICGSKPRIIVLNRMDLADPNATKKWSQYFKSKSMAVIATDCKTRKGIADFTPAARTACAEKSFARPVCPCRWEKCWYVLTSLQMSSCCKCGA